VERKTISIMKACELVGVSRRTIYNWLSSGKIEYVRTAGGSVRIFVDTLWRDANNADRPAVQAVAGRRPEPGVMVRALSVEELLAKGSMDESPELRLLFHRLNNHWGSSLPTPSCSSPRRPTR
jgi:DNA binding domain, excisionase family